MFPTPEETADLVARAASGDRQAWNRLVGGYEGLVWGIARRHRLGAEDAGDVCQTVWLRLIEHLDRISDPSRVGAWLATTTRRECLRVQARSRRTALVGEQEALQHWRRDDHTDDPDADVLREETRHEVRAALAQLPRKHHTLLVLLMADPSLSYQEIAESLDIPIGSIGPTRARCLKKLRSLLEDSGTYIETTRSM